MKSVQPPNDGTRDTVVATRRAARHETETVVISRAVMPSSGRKPQELALAADGARSRIRRAVAPATRYTGQANANASLLVGGFRGWPRGTVAAR